MLLKYPRISSEEKLTRQGHEETHSHPSPSLESEASQADRSQLIEDTKRKDSDTVELGTLSKYKAGQSSEPNLTWVHVAPILSPRKACPSHEGTMVAGSNENQPITAVLQPSGQGSPATQDSSISSTTPYKHPKNLKKPVQCQSQSVSVEQSENIEAFQGQNQPPNVTLNLLARVCTTPLET